MKVKLTANIMIEGKHTPAGTTIDVPEPLARNLIHRGRAAKIGGKPGPADKQTTGLDTENADALVNR